MNIVRDIQSLSDFKRDASKLVKRMRKTGEPMVLTVNGRPAVVVQDAESYQELVDAKEYAETVAVLRKRIRDVDNGAKMRTAEEFFQEFSKKHGIDFNE